MHMTAHIHAQEHIQTRTHRDQAKLCDSMPHVSGASTCPTNKFGQINVVTPTETHARLQDNTHAHGYTMNCIHAEPRARVRTQMNASPLPYPGT